MCVTINKYSMFLLTSTMRISSQSNLCFNGIIVNFLAIFYSISLSMAYALKSRIDTIWTGMTRNQPNGEFKAIAKITNILGSLMKLNVFRLSAENEKKCTWFKNGRFYLVCWKRNSSEYFLTSSTINLLRSIFVSMQSSYVVLYCFISLLMAYALKSGTDIIQPGHFITTYYVQIPITIRQESPQNPMTKRKKL